MSVLERRPDENDFEYHKRLVFGKLKDKTLAEYDYTELAPYVYGKDYACDVARRMMYGSCKTLSLLDDQACKNIISEDLFNELNLRKIEIQKERQKYFDQRREFNKLVTKLGRSEHLEDCLVKSAERLNQQIPLKREDLDYCEVVTDESEALIVFADWHYGMTTDNIYNTYNTDECRRRVSYTVAKAMERIALHGCSKLHVLLLGDLAHGAIHTSVRVASEELVCDQIMNVSELVAEAISILASCVKETHIYSTYGNHLRTVQNKNDSLHRDNMERLIPWWIAERFKNRNDVVVEPASANEFILMDVCGYTVCATHGDLDNIKTSGITLNALFSRTLGKTLDYVILADKHHKEDFESFGIDCLLVRSLCGTDDYANNRRLYSDPGQLLAVFNKYDGLDAQYNIKIKAP